MGNQTFTTACIVEVECLNLFTSASNSLSSEATNKSSTSLLAFNDSLTFDTQNKSSQKFNKFKIDAFSEDWLENNFNPALLTQLAYGNMNNNNNKNLIPSSSQTNETFASFTNDTSLFDYRAINSDYTTYKTNLNDPNNLTYRNLVCHCITLSYKCAMNKEQEKYTVESYIAKNIYLALYIILILTASVVNLLTLILLINDHRRSGPIKYIKSFIENKIDKNSKKFKLNNLKKTDTILHYRTNQMNSLNSASDILIIWLLLSYLIIIFYVVPNQAYLFYTNKNIAGLNCKISEFFKAFSVSLSIYSLVAVSLQRLFAIKFSQFSYTLISTRLLDSLNYVSVLAFLKSIGSILKTFFLSRCYRHYLITTVLVISTWTISCALGIYNMSHYINIDDHPTYKSYDYFEKEWSCKFPSDLLSSNAYCQNQDQLNKNSDYDEISKSDIIFVVILLVIPNLIVFSSYTWVCYHIWSHSSKLSKPVKYVSNSKTKPQSEQPTPQIKLAKSANDLTSINTNKNAASTKSSSSVCTNFLQVNNLTKEDTTHDSMTNLNSNDKSTEINNESSKKIALQKTENVQAIVTETIKDSLSKNKSKSKSSKISNDNNINNNNVKIRHLSIRPVENLDDLNNPTASVTNPIIYNSHQMAIKKRNKSVTLTTCLMVVCFTICWAPFFVFPMFYSKIKDTNTYNNVKVIIHLIGYSSAIWNPMILIIKSKRFTVQLQQFNLRIKKLFVSDSIPVINDNTQNPNNLLKTDKNINEETNSSSVVLPQETKTAKF